MWAQITDVNIYGHFPIHQVETKDWETFLQYFFFLIDHLIQPGKEECSTLALKQKIWIGKTEHTTRSGLL